MAARVSRDAKQNAGLRVTPKIGAAMRHTWVHTAGATMHQPGGGVRRAAMRPPATTIPEIRVNRRKRQVSSRTDFFLTRGYGNAALRGITTLLSRASYRRSTVFYLLSFRLIFPAVLQSSGIACAHS
jgi:hypothetical protein